MTEDEKNRLDREHIWHPYSGTVTPRPVWRAVGAEGVFIELADGRKLIDGISSWWTMAHGHRHPKIVEAMKSQLDRLPHVMFGGFTHDAAIELTGKLLKMVPSGMDKVFYSDSGSVACEVAMKMALQYFYATGERDRTRFLTVEHTYHGDTFATMALGASDGMHHCFSHLLTSCFTAPAPAMGFDNFQESDLEAMRGQLERHGREVAAVILEPVLQGAGGMRIYSPRYLAGLRKLCDEFGVLLIFDEIATGFGRTGRLFAASYAGVSPDIMCVGKALTGGHITLAATLCSDKVALGVSSGEPHALMHGPTFMANPVACAAGCASLDLFNETDWQDKVECIEAQLARELEPARHLPGVADVRVIGATGIVELDSPVKGDALCSAFVERGCWIRPFGSCVYLMPPFVIEPGQLAQLTGAVVDVLKDGVE